MHQRAIRRLGAALACAALAYFVVAVLPGDGPQPRSTAGAAEPESAAATPATATPSVPPAPRAASADAQPLYLTFQVFTDRSPKLWQGYELSEEGRKPVRFETASRAEMQRTVREIAKRIGTRGTDGRRLGFVIGPIALEYDDAQVRALIADAFAIAAQEDVAVGFHLDDSMFWSRRKDLWSQTGNVEWLEWEGTPNTGRRLDWGDPPRKLAPQMCYNAPAIEAEITRIARDVVGAAVKQGADQLASAGKADLFAGVIVGWETQLAKDAETNRPLGYCALTNRGFSAADPPADLDAEREQVVRDFITLWARGVASAGIPAEKIYSHTAFTSTAEHAEVVKRDPKRRFSYAEANNFAPPRVAFGPSHNPGFSTYPAPGLYPDLYAELARNGSPRWASAEGTNVRTGMRSGEDRMETYLARHFNHGAGLVNVFAWGVGPQGDPWRTATENPEALAAYAKFLRGEPLAESPIPADYGLPAKIQVIQRELPKWLAKAPNKQDAADLMEEMMGYVKARQPWKAEEVADRILVLIGASGSGDGAPPRND